MSEGSLGKSLRAAASGECDNTRGLEDFADFADSYFLESQPLVRDLTDASGVLSEQIVDLSPNASPQRSGIEATVLSFWNEAPVADKNAAEVASGFEGDGKTTAAVSKGTAEPMDSSDWDQTQERFGSQVGGQRPVATSTESPESVLKSRAKPETSSAEAQRLVTSSKALQPSEGFLHRDGSSNALDPDQQLPLHTHSYSRLLGLGDEAGEATPLGRGIDPWEGRGSNNFHSSPFMSRMQPSGLRSSLTAVENPHRPPPARGSWSSGEMAPGSMEEAGWGNQYSGKPLMRMMSDNLNHKRFVTTPVKRQYSEDLHDLPRGSLDILGGQGASPLDAMLGDMDPGRGSYSQGDPRRSHRRSKSHGIPPQSPMNRGSGPLFQNPVLGPPSDGTRKRRRDLYHLTGQEGQLGGHGRGRLLQEDLISHLKQQIAGLDQQTKSLMKMTLYRISRNANASADGIRESSQQNPRNAYLDKVVANFMYNRFSTRGAGMRSNQMSSGSHMDSGGYFNRSCSSPEINHPMAHHSLDMDT